MHRFRNRRAVLLTCRAALGMLAFGLLGGGSPSAQTFPTKPIKIILGLPPGSTIDTLTRIVGERVSEELGQPVIIENRPGAGGTIATEAVARAPADGHTLNVSGCSADAIVYGFVMTERPPLDPFKDFTPVGRLMSDHWVLAVSPALGVTSVNELVALGKSKPGTLTFPSPGVGSSQHLQNERFRLRVGIEATHVPYKDSPFPDLIAGRLSYVVQPAPALVPHIKSGKLKGLAVLSTERLAILPEVPTVAEVGLPDLVYNGGICLFAPGGTPRDVVMRLNTALNKAGASEAVRQRFADLGTETVQYSPEDTAKFIAELMALVDGLRLAVFSKVR
jgi:tripartite-type tricarboxylate transporter receptor subunit TctC